jgi:glutathione synthase
MVPPSSEYPPDLSAEEEQFLLTNLKDWSIAHGLAVRPAPTFVPSSSDPSGVLATTAPVTLFPSLFPRNCFDEGLALQTAYNELYSAIARDETWLKGIVEEYATLRNRSTCLENCARPSGFAHAPQQVDRHR